jgi:hypothetical protein
MRSLERTTAWHWGKRCPFFRFAERSLAQLVFTDPSLTPPSPKVFRCPSAVGNTIPCAMLATFHIFRDPELLARVRGNLNQVYGQPSLADGHYTNVRMLLMNYLGTSSY